MLFTILDDSIEFYATSPIFIGCLDGGCEGKKHNARYSQQLKTGTGQRATLRTVPPPRDRLPTGGQSELVLWWFVPDHIHSVSSSTPMFRPKRLALAVTPAIFLSKFYPVNLMGSRSWKQSKIQAGNGISRRHI